MTEDEPNLEAEPRCELGWPNCDIDIDHDHDPLSQWALDILKSLNMKEKGTPQV